MEKKRWRGLQRVSIMKSRGRAALQCDRLCEAQTVIDTIVAQNMPWHAAFVNTAVALESVPSDRD